MAIGRQAVRRVAPIVPAIVLGILAVTPLLSGKIYVAHLGAQASLLLLSVLSWDLFCQPARQINFGHALFVGGSAYASALLSTMAGAAPWLSILGATVVTGIVGSAVGVLTLRLHGPYFAMATMALQLFFFRSLFIFGGTLGGGHGLLGLPRLTSDPVLNALVPIIVGLATYCFCLWFRRSPFCLRLRAVGANEPLARASGLRAQQYRVAALGLSGSIAGLGGALHAHSFGNASPELASDWLSALVVLLGVLGSSGGVAGVAILTLTYFALKQCVLPLGGHDAPVLAAILLAWTWWRARLGPEQPGGTAAEGSQ